MERSKGRTYRFALKACLALSEGKDVLWVYGTENERIHAMRMMDDLQHNRRLPGKLEFRPTSSNFQGITGFDLVIEDELLGCNWRAIQAYLETKARCFGFLKR